MDEYLRRVRRLGEDAFEGSVHAVLGGPDPNVETVAATLCLALHLSQKEPSDDVCVPVLCGQRSELPRETARYLQRVKICESSLLWRGDVDLMKLHHTRRLSLTLLRDGLLDSSDCHALESSILRVVHHDRQQDAGDDVASSAVTTVTREILQEAAEHIRAALGETLGEALLLQRDALRDKQGHQSAQLGALMRSLEQWTNVSGDEVHEARLQADVDLEQLLMMDLEEFSDGEMTVAFTSVTTDKEDWHDDWKGLKSFTQLHGYDGLVCLLSIRDEFPHPYQKVAVYSNNTDISNQICCELEESSSWSLSCELGTRESVQVYRVPVNTSLSSGTPPLLAEEIQALLKDFFDRQRAILSRHPSSRTSSTEGVAGSVEFSQGSSGINDMDGSDIERAEGGTGDAVALARVIEDVEEGTGGAGVGAGGELVSPDSGMTTIRSSRSSKESSVFLSDDSPVAEAIAGGGPAGGPGGLFLRNPSPLGLLSLSPPVPPERKKHRSGRNKSDDIDLFIFDPLLGNEQSMQTGGSLADSRGRAGEDEKRAESSRFSEVGELSMLDFSAPNSPGMLERRDSSMDQQVQICRNDTIDTMVPPTPVNSAVGSCPPSTCGVRFFPEDVVERINGLQHKDSVSSSLSETWDELGFETLGALSSSDNYIWNRSKESGSPENILEEVQSKKYVDDITEPESREAISQSEETHQKRKTLEPMLSLVTEQTETYENWNPGSIIGDQWNPVTFACLQLTPPEEDFPGKLISGIIGLKEETISKKKAILSTLTPDTSKEDDEGAQAKKEDRQMELLDFWTYSAQKGFLKSDSGTTTSYPQSLDMWNFTIRDDSLSPQTTPENSETSGSFCGMNPQNTGAGTSLESPIGCSDGGMAMWNTTIREDSSPSLTGPEGAENGKDPSHDRSLDGSVSPKSDNGIQIEEEKVIEEERCTNKVFTQTPKDGGWKGVEHNVRIVIEVDEGGKHLEERGYVDTQSVPNPFFQIVLPKHSDDSADICEIPVSGMVTSNSEYDNVGASAWSRTPSPETYARPVVDMIELEGQYSPFVALTKPKQIDDQYQKGDTLVKTDNKDVISDKNKLENQVFLFEGTSELGHKTRIDESSIECKYGNNSGVTSDEDESLETSSNNSPFVLVDYYSAPQGTSANYYSSAGGDALIDQSFPRSPLKCDHFASGKQEPTSSSQDPPIPVVHIEDGTLTEVQGDPTNEKNGNLECKMTGPMSLSSSSGGELLKNSPDSLHPGSRDDIKSNSDGDSSSGLEMEYIIVSGTVKEVEKEWHDRPHQSVRQSKGTRTAMETFSMLSHAATVLRAQARAANTEDQEKTEQDTQHRMIGSTDSAMSAETNKSQADLSTHSQTGLDNAPEHPVVPEMMPPSQLEQSIQTKAEDDYDFKSSTVASSVSPSLRYPSDHFLKTREEVYVHSQISMEDSDEGGQSPSAPPHCPPSLGDLQVLRGHLERQDSPETTSESQSPVLTNSSVSHTSSLVGTPLSESGASPHTGLGLPFSRDLMEEENEDETIEEETNMEHTTLSNLTLGPRERGERPQSESTDLLSFTEELVGGSSFQQTDIRTFDPVDHHHKRRVRSANDCEKWSGEQHIAAHGSSQDGDPSLLRCSKKAEDTTGMMMKMTSRAEASGEMDNREDLSDGSNERRKLAAPPMDVSLEHTVGSALSEGALDTEDEALDTGDDVDIDIDELDTSDEADLDGDSEESNLGAEAEKSLDGTLWRSVVIGEQEHRIDMKCIEPYKRVISHGGYYAEENAIIVFAACFLPDSNCDNYNYIMENLFIYVISTLELMVAEHYMIVYLNGATPRRRMPGFTWMKRCYQMIDRRLKKNLKMFFIVHPSWFIRTLLGISRPFISSKFCSKIKYVNSLRELGETIPMEYVHIPPSIVKLDAELQDTAAKADKKRNSVV